MKLKFSIQRWTVTLNVTVHLTMNLKFLIPAILALVIIVIILPFTVHSIQETELKFETVSLQIDNLYSQNVSPKIYVITSPPQDPVVGISPTDSTSIEQVDFNRNLVIVAFLGTCTNRENKIATVKQFKSDVWVKAEIQASPEGETKYYPYQIITIARDQMPQTGSLDFILLNNLYEEKSRAFQTITIDQP
jgi:hypothetical protein